MRLSRRTALGGATILAAIDCALAQNLGFEPKAGATWNIELSKVPSVSQADDSSYAIWDFDMADAPKSTVQAFKDKGHDVICYFSAGTWENWRADADQFPADSLGNKLGQWPKEKWVDTRNAGVRAVMKQRIAEAKSKGCDGIDPDNIDAYENNSGFNLTKEDAVDYVKFLAQTANDVGLACGLKNGGSIIDKVIDVVAWSVNEQCVQYNECKPYQAFIKQDKPVFHLEYTAKNPAPAKFVQKSCSGPDTNGFSTLIKHLDLGSWTTTCE